MKTFGIFVVTILCFSHVFPIGFGIPLDEVNSGDDTNFEVQNVEKNLNMLRSLSCPANSNFNGIQIIKVYGQEPFEVLCNSDIAGPGWTVIASRSNANLNFFRNWKDYKFGFGSLTGDFYLGMDKLHALTDSQPHELYIYLEDFDGQKRFARYDEFRIGNETEKYIMSKLGTHNGTMADSLVYNRGRKFSTYDSDNSATSGKCMTNHFGAWWYGSCTNANLFGQYLNGTSTGDMANKGMYWYHWRNTNYSYKEMRMMVKPKCSC